MDSGILVRNYLTGGGSLAGSNGQPTGARLAFTRLESCFRMLSTYVNQKIDTSSRRSSQRSLPKLFGGVAVGTKRNPRLSSFHGAVGFNAWASLVKACYRRERGHVWKLRIYRGSLV